MRVKQFSPFVAALVVVCLVAWSVSSASATVIFGDGFESGNFGAWTASYGSPAVVSDVKHTGSYGAFVNASGTHSCYCGADSSAGWGNHLCARAYYKFDVSTADWCTRGLTYISNWTGSDQLIADAGLSHWQSNDYLWVLEGRNGPNLQLIEGSHFSLNTSFWYCVEVEVFVDDSAGYAKLYVDDVLVASLAGLDNNLHGNPNHVGFGQFFDIRNGEAVWWDDCVIANSYIGLEPLRDINGDGKIDMKDISYVARRFNCLPSDLLWNSVADINGDGKIDMKDISIIARHFGEHA